MAFLLSQQQAHDRRRKRVTNNNPQVLHHAWVIVIVAALVFLVLVDVVQGAGGGGGGGGGGGPIETYSQQQQQQHHTLAFPESTTNRRRQLRFQPPKFPDQTAPTLLDITGPFEMELQLRFDSFDPKFRGYHTVVNFSNIGRVDDIYVGASGSPNVISLLIFKTGKWHGVSAYDTVILGQVRTYIVGIEADGTAYVNVDGIRVATVALGQVLPENVPRSRRWWGSSDFANTRSMRGAILGLRITNKDEYERDWLERQFLANLPGQFFGSFRAGLYVQVDNTSSTVVDQGIVDLYTTNGVDNARLVCNKKQMRFELYQGGTVHSVTASNSVVAGEMAQWTIGVEDLHTMFLEKNGTRLASISIPNFVSVVRMMNVFGNLASGTAPLDGVAVGFRTETFFVS